MEDQAEDITAAIMLVCGGICFTAGMYGVLKRVGRPAWLAFIPLANLAELCQIAGLSPMWLLAIFVPGLNFAFAIYLGVQVADRFGCSNSFGVALGATGFVLLPMIGFGRAEDRRESGHEADLDWEEVGCVDRRSAHRWTQPVASGLPAATKAWLIATSVVYGAALLLSPGLMVIGAMAFDGGTPQGNELGLYITGGSMLLAPISILIAVIGGWVSHKKFECHRTALCLSAMPVANVVGFFAGIVIAGL